VELVSTTIFEEMVFSKPYFDPAGLLLAFHNDEPLGFVQTGFAPDHQLMDLDRSIGIISQLQVVPGSHSQQTAQTLISGALDYLRGCGAHRVYAGSRFPHSPFFLGMYGGSRVPGVLRDDLQSNEFFLANGFQKETEVLILQRRMHGFRPIVDRQQMSVRRQYQLDKIEDPTPVHWWDACTLGKSSRVRYLLNERSSQSEVARVTYWDMNPLASGWGVQAMGLFDLSVSEHSRRCGLGTFLVCESLRELAKDGVALVEAQLHAPDDIACGMFTKLGFEESQRGDVLSLRLT
jgi:GNAT superfamily N-acetyltransferase